MIALLIASQAMALDTDSLRSTATYDLYRDPYDFFDQPGVLAVEQERGVLTGLDLYGGPGRYTIGYYGTLGSGVLGAAFDFGNSASSAASTDNYDFDGDETITFGDSEAGGSAWNAHLTYGVSLSESMAAGVAIWVNQSGGVYSFDPQSGSLGGTRTDVDFPEGDDSSSFGQAKLVNRSITALAGASFFSDKGYFSLNAGLRTVLSRGTVSAGWESGDNTITYSGYVPGLSFSDNRKGVGAIASIEAVQALSDTKDLRVTVGVGFIPGSVATIDSKVETEGEDTYEASTESWKDAKWRSTSAGVLAALHIQHDDMSVRPGLRIGYTGYADTVTPVSSFEYDYGDAGDGDGSSEYNYSSTAVGLELGLPLAVEVPLGQNDIWTLRMAADWSWSRTKATATTIYEDKDADIVEQLDTQSSASSSAASASFGLCYWPVERFRMDAAIFGGTSFDGSDATLGDTFGLGAVSLSATLLLP